MPDESKKLAKRGYLGERRDAGFFYRNKDRGFRLRRPGRHEFPGYSADYALVVLHADMTTMTIPVWCDGEIPDDDRVLAHMWNELRKQTLTNGGQPVNFKISEAMIERLMGASINR